VTDRPRRPDLDELERALADLGGHLAYPPTPDLATSVRARLVAVPPPAAPWHRRLRTRPPLMLAAAILVVLLAVGVALVASPSARAAIAERLGVPGVTIWHIPIVPDRTPMVATPVGGYRETPTLVPVNVRLSLGEPLASLAEARARVPYAVLAPTLPELGTPDELYLEPRPVGGQVALVYRARPGLPESVQTGVAVLVTQFQGRLEPGLIGKGLGPNSRLEQVAVNGRSALWIEGFPHQFIYYDRDGKMENALIRLAGNVLLWEQGGLTLRIEGSLSKEQALRIAESVR
jgi:hypothetical protein